MEEFRNLRMVFMGTPDFAVASLAALLAKECMVAGVITAPDKPAGRGMKPQESAVKKFALEKGLNILQPPNLKDPTFLQELAALKADLQIVVAFRMLPEIVWNMPRMGTINVHGSLLPQYRGAAPINWAIINGETETGVTTFKLQHQIDTGDILLQEKIAIGADETAGEIHDKMRMAGADLLVETIRLLAAGELQETPQTQVIEPLKHAPKIFTKDCRINWNKSAGEIHNLIRGVSPYPGAFTNLEEKIFKIYRSKKLPAYGPCHPGSIDTDKKTFLQIAAIDGWISVLELQLEGKKKMNIEDFLRGYKFSSI